MLWDEILRDFNLPHVVMMSGLATVRIFGSTVHVHGRLLTEPLRAPIPIICIVSLVLLLRAASLFRL